MAKTKKIDIKQVIADALEHYHKMKPSIKESTKRQNESLLSEFYRFVDTLPARDKTMKILSQKGLNRYKEYLIDKMNATKTDGKKKTFGVGQLNRCGSMIARLINSVLYPNEVVPSSVVWVKVEDTRREDQKGHFPLLVNEVIAIENCSGLKPVDEEYRDIFLLQIECGQRVSDLAKILTGKYMVKHGRKFEYIVLSTIKENIKAYIPLRPKMKMWMEKVKSHKLVDSIQFEKKTKGKGNGTYNEAIRRIAKKAGLDREIVRIDSLLLEVRGPLYEEITNHAARCTFITNMLKKGVSTERLSKMTGHASDEMIKRVYAQLTDEDEINRIEFDLYSDMDDDDANSPTNTSSNIPKKHNTDATVEALPEIFTPKDFDPKTVLESNEYIAYDNYIRGLNDLVDRTINEMNAYQLYVDDIESFCQAFLIELKQQFEQFKQKFESEVKSQKFDHPNLSQILESVYDKMGGDVWEFTEPRLKSFLIEEEYFDNPKTNDLALLCLFRAWIDYLKEIHSSEGVIESLEKKFKSICEENPSLFIAYQNMPHYKLVWPIIKFSMVAIKMEQFIQENRPIADNTMIQEDNTALKFLTDWRVVFRELQKTPAMTLGTLIQNTKCGGDVKSVLYNSVKEGDFESFKKTIITHEQEVRILINHSYSNQYIRMFTQTVDYLFKESTTGMEDPIEMINRYNEALLLLYPFVDKDLDESTSVFLKKSIQEIDIKELYLWKLDGLLKAFDDESKNYLNLSEKKIFDKVLSIVDFNKHPQLKEAYEEYKAKQKAVTNQTIVEATIASEEDKRKNRKNDGTRVNYLLPVSIQNLDIDKLIRLLTEKDELNKFLPFITVLEWKKRSMLLQGLG